MRSFNLFLLIFSLAFLSSLSASAQEVLNTYTAKGLENNLQQQQLSADYDKALWALTEAKRAYGPTVDVVGQYTRSFSEGRDVPASLEAMLSTINLNYLQDGNIYFPAPNQYQAGIQVNQTIYNAQLKYKKNIQQSNAEAGKAKLEDFKIALATDIRTAYFQYLQAMQVRKAQQEGLKLGWKNLNAIEKLIQVQKATKDVLYKAKANVSAIKQALNNADKDQRQAAMYFNFLRNAPLDEDIKVDSAYLFKDGAFAIERANTTTAHQYNLTYLQKTTETAEAQLKLTEAGTLPVVQFSGLGGIRGQAIDLVRDEADYQYHLQASQLQMADASAYADVQTQLQNYAAVQDAYKNAQVYYDAVAQKFQLGTAGILDLTDAQNNLIQATAQRQVWYYDLLKKAEAYQKTAGKTIQIQEITKQ
ncbi:MAG: TolC family protein [Pedobacter sp.]|nr:MAG: TolC family protein [Pedobacter sp.]